MFRNKVDRSSTFKKGLGDEDGRRRREDVAIQLSKARREEQLQKRRLNSAGQLAGQEGSASAAAAAGELRPEELRAKLSELSLLVDDVNSDDPHRQLSAVTMFRKLLSIEINPPIQQIIDAGVVPRLVTFMSAHKFPALVFEAAWTLTNIASGNSQQTRHVCEKGGVQQFVALLSSPSEDVREQAVWALGNIAGDSPECRDFVLKCGAMQPIVDLCVPTAKLTLLRNATWTISNLCRGKPQPQFHRVACALPKLAQLIHTTDEEILADACWALSYISDDKGEENTKIKAVIDSGALPKMVALLGHKSNKIQTPALRTIGNIVTGNDQQTQAALDCRVLNYLAGMLQDGKKAIRKEACWAISNITAGSPHQITACIEAGVFPPLIHLLRSAEFEVKKEAAWAVSNATSGGQPKQIAYLVEQGVLPALSDLTTSADPKIVMVALEGLEHILRMGALQFGSAGNKYAEKIEEIGGLDNIESCQKHDNDEIYQKAQSLITKYFSGEDDSQDKNTQLMLAPQQSKGSTDAGMFSFGGSSSGSGSSSFGTGAFSFGGPSSGEPFAFSLGKPAMAVAEPQQPVSSSFAFKF